MKESVDALGQLTPPCGAGTAGERFVLRDGGEEVCDNTTGLFWEQMPDSVGRFQQESIDYCSTLRAGSRLPEIKELISLVDFNQVLPALPAGHPFDNIQFHFPAEEVRYFSATSRSEAAAWFVNMASGEVVATGPDNPFSTWCVRSGNGDPDANVQ